MKICKLSFLILVVTLFSVGCNNSSSEDSGQSWIEFRGQTMGTYYSVVYQDREKRNFQQQIDSIFLDLNNSVSVFIPNSLISLINKSGETTEFVIDENFYQIFQKSAEVRKNTNKAFDPTVMPPVNFWGFGHQRDFTIDSSKIDSLRQLVNFDSFDIHVSTDPGGERKIKLKKMHPGVQLDFGAIAKGYGGDIVGDFLSSKGIKNWMVDMGGDVATRGNYKENEPWRIGLEKPVEGNLQERQFFAILGLNGQAIATSGNYRNIREIDGERYAHTINPATGYPEASDILSASVIAADCMTADAYATGFMVLGIEKSMEIAESLDYIEAHFIYFDENGIMKDEFTSGFEKYILMK